MSERCPLCGAGDMLAAMLLGLPVHIDVAAIHEGVKVTHQPALGQPLTVCSACGFERWWTARSA